MRNPNQPECVATVLKCKSGSGGEEGDDEGVGWWCSMRLTGGGWAADLDKRNVNVGQMQ